MFRNKKYVFTTLLTFLSFVFVIGQALAFTITDSGLVSMSAVVGTLPTVDTGGGSTVLQSGVRFSGYAYPEALVTVQKGLQKITTVTADANGYFTIVVAENNTQLFSLYVTDKNGDKSTLLNFPTMLYSGYLTDITGIRFAPTITSDKLSVKKTDYITFTGYALPDKELILTLQGPEQVSYSLSADENGIYSITIPALFSFGTYAAKIGYENDTRVSKLIQITVGTTTTNRFDTTENIPGDCDVDQHITITDFSVLAYWFGKKNPPLCVDTNRDGLINLTDFSILAFYWNE